jgi:hypothetical protein
MIAFERQGSNGWPRTPFGRAKLRRGCIGRRAALSVFWPVLSPWFDFAFPAIR